VLKVQDYLIILSLIGFFALSQYFLRLQFLVPSKGFLIFIFLLQFPLSFFLAKRKFLQFSVLTILSAFVWSVFTVYLHKDIYTSIKKASVYASNNLTGKIVYNDISGVAGWYLNYSNSYPKTEGSYLDTEVKENLAYNELTSRNIDYIMFTNEHNVSLTFDISKKPYLERVKEFRYNVNGKTFFTEIVKFKKDTHK